MLDIETLGTKPGSIIVSIGAVRFTENEITDKFYGRIDPKSSEEYGFTMDVSTVLWWLNQSDASRAELYAPGRDLTEVLGNFTVWALRGGMVTEMWGCGADFDNAHLAYAYQKLRENAPWSFWTNRCYRTMKALFPQAKVERIGTHHNALDDAATQAQHLIEIQKMLSPVPTSN